MNTTYKISGMTCGGCAASVTKALRSIETVNDVQVDFQTGTATITSSTPVQEKAVKQALEKYPAYQLAGDHAHRKVSGFWADLDVWKRASFNTLNCLIGCSIGDFAMIMFLQYYYPSTSMVWQMILGTTAGLATSVALETAILNVREKFPWGLALRTALSMSFISMVAMELAMNTTDFMITGGKAAFGNPLYYTALLVALVAGFIVPLPYNYFKLKKYNKACH